MAVAKRKARGDRIRQRILTYMEQGLDKDQICDKIGIARQTLNYHQQVMFETGILDGGPPM